MLEGIVQDQVTALLAEQEEWQRELAQNFDFCALEAKVGEAVNRLGAEVLKAALSAQLVAPEFIRALKDLGGRLGMRLKGYRLVKVHLGSGQSVEVVAPYFVKAAPKGRHRARRQGAYLGLEVLGFLRRWSSRLVSEVAQAALLCPSFEVAHAVFERRGLEVDVKTLRCLCRVLFEQGRWFRGKISLSGTEPLAGQTLVIGIDGGRLRERRRKRGRKKAGQKRQGYHTDWKEPKLFTLYVLDNEGQVVKSFAPLHDATMRNHEGLFALLERYLDVLDLERVARIVFCGDGAPWIWSGVDALCQRRGLDQERVYQVIDYTHAKQNLQELGRFAPRASSTRGSSGQTVAGLAVARRPRGATSVIMRDVSGQEKGPGAQQMRQLFCSQSEAPSSHARFRELAVPCGSGCVKSAIRRVIYLRLKAPGTFWPPDMAECFLFLRSQLLSGRWDSFIYNVARLKARLLEPLPKEIGSAEFQAAEYLQAA
ncbi:MAG: hypothetical protein WA970_07655 [Gammaproteobacteria bacterium]